MTVTFLNLVGTRENLDKTIRYNLETYWDLTKTSNVLPLFRCDTEDPTQFATNDNTGPNEIRIGLIGRKKAELRDYLGDGAHGWVQEIIIECQAENLSVMTLFEDEVNRILWEHQPTKTVRLVKSDATNSEAAEFMESELEFNRVAPEGTEDQLPTSQGLLSIVYYKYIS